MAKPVYRCPYCLTTKISKVDLGGQCPGCFKDLPKDLQPIYEEKESAFRGTRSIGKISKPQAVAGLILIIVALGYFTSLDRSNNSSYTSNGQKNPNRSDVVKQAGGDLENEYVNQQASYDAQKKLAQRQCELIVEGATAESPYWAHIYLFKNGNLIEMYLITHIKSECRFLPTLGIKYQKYFPKPWNIIGPTWMEAILPKPKPIHINNEIKSREPNGVYTGIFKLSPDKNCIYLYEKYKERNSSSKPKVEKYDLCREEE